MSKIRIVVCLSFLSMVAGLSGQKEVAVSRAIQQMVDAEIINIGLSKEEIRISSNHYSDHNNVHYVYLQQVYQGIDVWGVQANLVIQEKVKVSHTDKLVTEFAAKVNLTKHKIGPQDALSHVVRHLNLPYAKSKGKINTQDGAVYTISNLPYTHEEVSIKSVWALGGDTTYHKSWEVRLMPNTGPEDYVILVSGYNGEIIKTINRTISCHYDAEHSHAPKSEESSVSSTMTTHKPNGTIGEGQYRVFAAPVESPNHGNRSLVESPGDEQASAYGWHDTNGVQGPEYTITRGNNVHAYQDQSADNTSEGDEPDGGDKLVFDFPFDRDATIQQNLDADVTNLFYWNNYIHDWSYRFGFNESAGNFQENNYAKGGRGQDYVKAETIDGGDTGNANFGTPDDGDNGRMQMYRWIVGGDFEVMNPSSISGPYRSRVSNFGPTFKPQVSGNIVLAQDAINEIGDACEAIINASSLRGNIAMIDRGICDFSFKVFAAQEAGAQACIVCNNLPDAPLVSMGAGENADRVSIPAIFLSLEDCQLIKDEINASRAVSAIIEGTKEVSSALDNGIVAHEYGHGISLRLVGGASNSSCLTNDEQMGEGWSDFFALVLTQTPGDEGAKARGIGTYALGEGLDGRGIRRYQYSTDMEINPQTHSHIRATSTDQAVGEVWMTALWDMYWLYIDTYGYDATWKDRSSGNFRAVQNVMDGMKIQPCDASLLDARDAILTADALNYLSEGECLIWRAFARRGMGVDAIGGNGNWRYDNADGFEVPPYCGPLPRVTRTATPIIEVGDELEVTIGFETDNVALSDITITDIVPLLATPGIRFGTVMTPGVSADVDGAMVIFSFDNVSNQSLSSIKYTLQTQGLTSSSFDYYEDFEGEVGYLLETNSQEVEGWSVSRALAAEGQRSLSVAGNLSAGIAYATVPTGLRIEAQNSLLRFDHRYDAQLGFDGGQVEISQDNGASWDPIVESEMIVNPYKDRITYDSRYTRTAAAFTGSDTMWHTSVVDLSGYVGSDIRLRFAYVQQDFLEIEPYEGWAIDNVEVFGRTEILGTTRMTTNNSDISDTFVTYLGSSARTTPTIDILNDIRPMVLTPNPAIEAIWASFSSEKAEDGLLRVVSIEGKVLLSEPIKIREGRNDLSKELTSLASGTYILEIRSASGSLNQKFIKQ